VSGLDETTVDVDPQGRRARKRGKGFGALTSEQRHCVRIALKNLRYGADFFASLFHRAPGAKSFVKRLGDLQDALGSYNDAIVANETIAALEQEAGAAASRAAGIVLGWCGHRASASDGPLEGSWRAYLKARRFWR
jgi:CHAD domain-containing protein